MGPASDRPRPAPARPDRPRHTPSLGCAGGRPHLPGDPENSAHPRSVPCQQRFRRHWSSLSLKGPFRHLWLIPEDGQQGGKLWYPASHSWRSRGGHANLLPEKDAERGVSCKHHQAHSCQVPSLPQASWGQQASWGRGQSRVEGGTGCHTDRAGDAPLSAGKGANTSGKDPGQQGPRSTHTAPMPSSPEADEWLDETSENPRRLPPGVSSQGAGVSDNQKPRTTPCTG